MPWGLYDTSAEPERYPELDPFRRAVARASRDGRHVGHLATRASLSWGLVGWRWWRPRWGDRVEVLDARLTLHTGPRSPRVVDDVLDADFDGTVFWLGRSPLSLTWLLGPERDAAWEQYGWDGDDELTWPSA